MTANVEAMAYVGSKPWHGIGNELMPGAKSAACVLSTSELLHNKHDHTPIKVPPTNATRVNGDSPDWIITSDLDQIETAGIDKSKGDNERLDNGDNQAFASNLMALMSSTK